MDETDYLTCVLCRTTTDQVQAFPALEKWLRARFPAVPRDEIEEVIRPLGLCTDCGSLPEDRISVLLAAKLRNDCVEHLIASGVSARVARDYVATFPWEPQELFEFLRRPIPLPRKKGGFR